MPKWTQEQVRLLMQCSQLGAKACRDLIRQKFDVNHSVSAVMRKGERLGLPMKAETEPCPMCGSTEHIVRSSGYCQTCHNGWLESKEYIKRQEFTALDAENEARSRRRYNRIRKENQRAARKSKQKQLDEQAQCSN